MKKVRVNFYSKEIKYKGIIENYTKEELYKRAIKEGEHCDCFDEMKEMPFEEAIEYDGKIEIRNYPSNKLAIVHWSWIDEDDYFAATHPLTKDEAIDAILKYYSCHEDEFIEDIEELDSWNDYLGDDRYYSMNELDELFSDKSHESCVVPCFRFDAYGNLVSTDHKDYSNHLNDNFVKALIENVSNLNLFNKVEMLIRRIDE